MIATELLWRMRLPDGVVIRCEVRTIGDGFTLSAAIRDELLLSERYTGRRARADYLKRAEEMREILVSCGAIVERRAES